MNFPGDAAFALHTLDFPPIQSRARAAPRLLPSKLRPVPPPQREPSLKSARKLDAAIVAKAQHDFDVLTSTLENHPDLRAALYAALEQDGAFEELFRRSA